MWYLIYYKYTYTEKESLNFVMGESNLMYHKGRKTDFDFDDLVGCLKRDVNRIAGYFKDIEDVEVVVMNLVRVE